MRFVDGSNWILTLFWRSWFCWLGLLLGCHDFSAFVVDSYLLLPPLASMLSSACLRSSSSSHKRNLLVSSSALGAERLILAGQRFSRFSVWVCVVAVVLLLFVFCWHCFHCFGFLCLSLLAAIWRRLSISLHLWIYGVRWTDLRKQGCLLLLVLRQISHWPVPPTKHCTSARQG